MAAFLFSSWGYIFLYLHLICVRTSLLGTDHYFSGGGGDEKLSSANIFFHFFFSVFFLFALNITIALLNYWTMMYKEQKGHSIRNNRNFVKKDLIDEAQESTNYIIEDEIHAPCGSESVNATLYQM